jgi:vacuolar-type H+-ATPase subunit B/Vma2
MAQRGAVRFWRLEVRAARTQDAWTDVDTILGNRAVVQVFEGTSGVDVKKVRPHSKSGDSKNTI